MNGGKWHSSVLTQSLLCYSRSSGLQTAWSLWKFCPVLLCQWLPVDSSWAGWGPGERVNSSEISTLFILQGVDTEQKEKGSKGDVTKMFGANTPTVSCSFGSKIFDTHHHASLFVGILKIRLAILYCSTGSHVYHLRVYMYQARNLNSMDKDSFSGKSSLFVKS